MPHSHHSHSGQFCRHASGTLEDVVKEAIRRKFQVYGLTEHAPRYRMEDLYPEEDNMSVEELSAQFIRFLDEAHRLKVLYAPQISLLVGLETEYITETDLGELNNLLTRVGDRVAYLVGSIHHVNGIPIDFDQATYQRALESFPTLESGADEGDDRQTAFLSAYFDAQYELIRRFKPEIIGHFDLCRLYCPTLRFESYPAVWEKIQRNIQTAVAYGALFEVSAAAFRKNWSTAYPGSDIVKLIQSFGGRFALSDDSHGPHAVGLNYHRLAEYLRSMGISELWYLQESMELNSAGRYIQAVALSEEWLDHPVWTRE